MENLSLLQDRALIEDILNGQKEKFALLMNKYSANIYGVLCGMGSGEQDTQDLTQETFIQAYRKLAHHQRDRSFAAWLYRIAVNLLKEKGRRKIVRQEAVNGQHMDSQRMDGDTPEKHYLRKERQAELSRLIGQLSDDYRLVLLLRYTNELSYEEIGEITGLPLNKVRNCLYRAKQGLKKRMEAEGVRSNEMLQS